MDLDNLNYSERMNFFNFYLVKQRLSIWNYYILVNYLWQLFHVDLFLQPTLTSAVENKYNISLVHFHLNRRKNSLVLGAQTCEILYWIES